MMTTEERRKSVVQLEIGLEKLEALFLKGDLCVADLRCLNCVSKACVQQMCLHLCAHSMQPSLVRNGGKSKLFYIQEKCG